MPLGSLKTWVADEDFLAVDINGNFVVVRNKFSETAGVGILDADCATDMGLSGLKLSNASGKQVVTDRIADDAVDAAKLSDSTAVDANRAVTTNHIRDAAVVAAKLGAAAVIAGKVKTTTLTVAHGGATIASGSAAAFNTGLAATVIPVLLHWERAAGAAALEDRLSRGLFYSTATSTWWVSLGNMHESGGIPAAVNIPLAGLTLKLIYIAAS